MAKTPASTSEEYLRNRMNDGGFAIALSGGGHRATLATLGALLAIVDRGLAGKIMQVASVSGGAITNAFVAQHCDLEKLQPFELDATAKKLATAIIRDGVLTPGWFVLMFLSTVVAGTAVGLAVHMLVLSSIWLSVPAGFVAALFVLLGRGLLVEWLLDRRYFRQSPDDDRRQSNGRALLRSVSGSSIDHVFCMTDLVLGLPVYASSQHGGIMFRRLSAERRGRDRTVEFQTFDGGQMSLAGIVRASAAFPGIPPRRMTYPPDKQNDIVANFPSIGYLADGGLWNNLGSQVLREDQFMGHHFAWWTGTIRPYGTAPSGLPLLCVNGSAPLRPTSVWAFRIPGLALLKSLFQTTNILNANTVLPRVEAMRRAFIRRTGKAERPDFLDPADLIVDLRPLEETSIDYLEATWGTDLIAKTDPKVRDWERSALIRLRIAQEAEQRIKAGRESRNEVEARIDYRQYLLDNVPEPQGSYPVCGLADIVDWDALRQHPDWQHLLHLYGTGDVGAPTTLGRIDKALARRLIARSYLNTYLVSLFLSPLREGELDRLGDLPSRLDDLVGDRNHEAKIGGKTSA